MNINQQNLNDLKGGHKSGSWGTRLDDLEVKNCPPKFVGLSFREMDHAQLGDFFRASDIEKFEMAYWIERMNSRRSGCIGICLGVFITLLFFLLIYSNK